MSGDLCSVLREVAELVASIYVFREDGDHVVKTRVGDLLNKLDSLISSVMEYCGRECYEEITKLIYEKRFREEEVYSILAKLHNCMVNYGCRSNVSIVE